MWHRCTLVTSCGEVLDRHSYIGHSSNRSHSSQSNSNTDSVRLCSGLQHDLVGIDGIDWVSIRVSTGVSMA